MIKQKDQPEGLNIFSIPLISQYRALIFSGLADGSPMTPQFDLDMLTNKIMVVKSIRLIPYASDDIVDFYVSDGVSTFKETLPVNIRLNNVLDQFNEGTSIRILINGTPLPIFSNVFSSPTGEYFPDLWLDNIYYKYPEQINSNGMSVQIFSTVVDDPSNPTASVILNMKVLIECYLI